MVVQGNTTKDTTECKTCNATACKPANILLNQCTGRGTSDRSRCVSCFPNNGQGCSANQYVSTLCSAALCELLPGVVSPDVVAACTKSASIYDGQCTSCKTSCSSSGSGQYILVPCSGSTASDIVCADCAPAGCRKGQYIADACSGTTSFDTTQCTDCTCPAGRYAPNNTCTGLSTANNSLSCIACTSTCPAGQFLAGGECSTFFNPRCANCRSPCGLAEIEVKACNVTSDRKCLPNPSCYQDCPSGEQQ